MWDLKLLFIDFFYTTSTQTNNFVNSFINFINPQDLEGLNLYAYKLFYQFSQNMTFFFAIKFLLVIMFLILIRGGTPRYRYDYLTKLGWLKFIGLTLLTFVYSLIFFFIY